MGPGGSVRRRVGAIEHERRERDGWEQAVLTREPPLRLWAIVDEAALHRPVGGVKARQVQLEHLAAATEMPQVTLQALPTRWAAIPAFQARLPSSSSGRWSR